MLLFYELDFCEITRVLIENAFRNITEAKEVKYVISSQIHNFFFAEA